MDSLLVSGQEEDTVILLLFKCLCQKTLYFSKLMRKEFLDVDFNNVGEALDEELKLLGRS